MTPSRDDVIRMAEEAGFGPSDMNDGGHDRLERFAALVAAAEREACALVAEDDDHEVRGRGYYDQLGDARATVNNIAAAIRARSAA